MKHPYIEVYPFKISEKQRIIFCEDMHECKVLSYNENFDAVLFENRESAQYTCDLLNAMDIDGLSVYVVGEPFRIHLNDRPNKVTEKPVMEFQTRQNEYEITRECYQTFTENDIEDLLDHMASSLTILQKHIVEDKSISVKIQQKKQICSIHYYDSKGKKLHKEGYSHISFSRIEPLHLVYSESVLMLQSEYNWELP